MASDEKSAFFNRVMVALQKIIYDIVINSRANMLNGIENHATRVSMKFILNIGNPSLFLEIENESKILHIIVWFASTDCEIAVLKLSDGETPIYINQKFNSEEELFSKIEEAKKIFKDI